MQRTKRPNGVLLIERDFLLDRYGPKKSSQPAPDAKIILTYKGVHYVPNWPTIHQQRTN